MTTIFFFSSRRRHTSWPRDWSSDVCSSDLPTCRHAARKTSKFPCACRLKASARCRSEERRVGKECRSVGMAAYDKENKRSQGTVAGNREKQRIRDKTITETET